MTEWIEPFLLLLPLSLLDVVGRSELTLDGLHPGFGKERPATSELDCCAGHAAAIASSLSDFSLSRIDMFVYQTEVDRVVVVVATSSVDSTVVQSGIGSVFVFAFTG